MSQYDRSCSSINKKGVEMQHFIRTLILTVLLLNVAQSAEILCLVGTAAHNKPEWTQPLFKELIARGHDLTLVSTASNYDEELIDNVEYIQLDNTHNVTDKQYTDPKSGAYRDFWPVKHMLIWYESHLAMCREVLGSRGFQRLYNPDGQPSKHFDLIIHDATYGIDCLLSLAQQQPDTPILALSSGKLNTIAFEVVRAYDTLNPAVIPYFTSDYPLDMSFWQRLQNHVIYVAEYFLRAYVIKPLLSNSSPKFAEAIDTRHERIKMLLLNTHSSIDYVQNRPPNVLEVAGLHIDAPSEQNLPQQLQLYARQFSDGLVFISLPNSQFLSSEQIQSIVKAIESFKHVGFLCSWANRHTLADKPKNLLFIDAKLRQQDVLALPNVKAFVTHADSFSLQEAVYSGVPVLAVPLILEEFNTAQRILERQIGVVLKATTFTDFEFYTALAEIFNNDVYAKRVQQLQQSFRNRDKQPVDQAIWCVEQLLASPNNFDHLVPPKETQRNFFVRHSLDMFVLFLVFASAFFFNTYYVMSQAVKTYHKDSAEAKAKQKRSKSITDKKKKK